MCMSSFIYYYILVNWNVKAGNATVKKHVLLRAFSCNWSISAKMPALFAG